MFGSVEHIADLVRNHSYIMPVGRPRFDRETSRTPIQAKALMTRPDSALSLHST